MKLKMVLITLFLTMLFSLNVHTGLHAQSEGKAINKEKPSLFKSSDRIRNASLPAISKFKLKNDNDIGRWVEQYNSSEGWTDDTRSTYAYSSDRLTITQSLDYFDGQDWVEEGSITMMFTDDGYPLSVTSEYFGDSYSELFHYSETGRLDSLTFEETYEGVSYIEKMELTYITEDSIRFNNIYREDSVTVNDEGYFVNKDGNFIEAYVEDGFIDRYTAYGISFNDYLKNIYNEFFFVEIYNDEFYSVEEGWVPYSKTTITEENGVVTEILDEYYDDFEEQWIAEYRYIYSYESNKIVQEDEFYSYDGIEWTEEYRTLYTYGTVVSAESDSDQAAAFKLSQNYPNPFNPTTRIAYSISKAANVQLEVYNVLGQRVATLVNANQLAGEYTATFNAGNFPSGIYYYKLMTAGAVEVRSMTLIK